MTLRNIPYTTSSGEWLPHNAGNYTSRSKAMFFFHSLDNATTLLNSDITFTNSVDLSVGSTETMSDEWPLSTGVIIGPTNFPALQKPAYRLAYSSVTGIMDINLTGPYTNATYEAVSAPVGSLAADQNIFDSYKTDISKILEFNKSTSSFEINSNFRSFRWGNIQRADGTQIDCDGVVSTPSFISITEVPAVSISPLLYTLKLQLSNNQDFPDDLYQSNPIWSTNSSTPGVIQFNPELLPSSLTGNLIEVNNPVAANIQSNTYLLLGNNLGRYYVKGVYEKDPSTYVLDVDRIDGEEFQLGSHTGVSISDISVRPRLRVKYRLRDNPSTGIFYKFFSVQNPDSTYTRLNPLGTKPIENKLESDTLAFIESPNQLIDVGGSIEIDMGGAPNLTPLAFGLNTSLDIDGSGNATRLTPWRKAYRFISRFKPKTVDIHQVKTANPNPFDGVVKFKVSQGTARSKPTSVNANHNYPLAISHRPPCIQHSNPGDVVNEQKGFGDILVDYDFDAGMLMSGTYRQDEVTGEYLFAGNGDHFIERENDGFVFEENGLPNAMFFEANLNDAFNNIDYNYDYTGLVSCAKTVIPAYSGEILYFDTTHGFIKNNYTNSDIGITNRTAVFVDITETDEVLRWSGVNYERPDEFWRQTFTTMVVKNKTTNEPLTVFSDYAVLKTDKDNYVVVMYADEGENITINDGDVIEIVFRNKKVLSTWQNSNDIPDPSVPGLYTTLNYRDINQEWIDDVRSPYTEPSLPNFRIESDGTVDGTITIVPDGVLPEGVEFRLYIQDDETTP